MHKQKGFSAVEFILILIIVSIVGFAGWFVWNSQKQIAKTLDDTNKSATAVIATKKEVTAESTPVATNYLTVKEWGVKFEIPSSIKNMQYNLRSGGVDLDSSDVVALAGNGKDCTLGGGYLGAIDRVDPSTTELAGMVKIKQIGNYAYWYGGAQQACLPDGVDTSASVQTSAYASSALQLKVVDSMPTQLKDTLVAE